jgi:hypothetical protein
VVSAELWHHAAAALPPCAAAEQALLLLYMARALDCPHAAWLRGCLLGLLAEGLPRLPSEAQRAVIMQVAEDLASGLPSALHLAVDFLAAASESPSRASGCAAALAQHAQHGVAGALRQLLERAASPTAHATGEAVDVDEAVVLRGVHALLRLPPAATAGGALVDLALVDLLLQRLEGGGGQRAWSHVVAQHAAAALAACVDSLSLPQLGRAVGALSALVDGGDSGTLAACELVTVRRIGLASG